MLYRTHLRRLLACSSLSGSARKNLCSSWAVRLGEFLIFFFLAAVSLENLPRYRAGRHFRNHFPQPFPPLTVNTGSLSANWRLQHRPLPPSTKDLRSDDIYYSPESNYCKFNTSKPNKSACLANAAHVKQARCGGLPTRKTSTTPSRPS